MKVRRTKQDWRDGKPSHDPKSRPFNLFAGVVILHSPGSMGYALTGRDNVWYTNYNYECPARQIATVIVQLKEKDRVDKG